MNECPYCKPYSSKFLMITDAGDKNYFVDITGDFLRIFDDDMPGLLAMQRINYCPICGRRLNDG